MFERFTDRARRIVVLSQEEASALDHNHIGTEHILLGLLHESEGVAGGVLTSLGISLDAGRQEVVRLSGPRDLEEQPQGGHIPFTPRAKKVLELSLRESLQLGHNYIGSEHILLGLIREGQGVGARVLVNLGADLGRTRQQLVALARAEADPGMPEPGAMLEPPRTASLHSRLGEIAERLTSIEDQVRSIADRLAAIERHLGGEPPEAAGPARSPDPPDSEP